MADPYTLTLDTWRGMSRAELVDRKRFFERCVKDWREFGIEPEGGLMRLRVVNELLKEAGHG